MRAASLRHFGILSDTTRTSFLSASKFAVKMTWCPSCPFTASGLMMVQLLPSIVLTNVLPVSLIVPVTRTSFLESSAFISSWFVVSCAEATPKVSRATAKQTAINNVFMLFSGSPENLQITNYQRCRRVSGHDCTVWNYRVDLLSAQMPPHAARFILRAGVRLYEGLASVRH